MRSVCRSDIHHFNIENPSLNASWLGSHTHPASTHTQRARPRRHKHLRGFAGVEEQHGEEGEVLCGHLALALDERQRLGDDAVRIHGVLHLLNHTQLPAGMCKVLFRTSARSVPQVTRLGFWSMWEWPKQVFTHKHLHTSTSVTLCWEFCLEFSAIHRVVFEHSE